MTSGGGRRVAWAGTRRKPIHGGSKCAIHGALRSQPRLPGTLQPSIPSGRWEELASGGCGGRCPSRHAPGPGPGRSTLLLSVPPQPRMAWLYPRFKWMGSRRVPRPHPRRPATHQPEMPLLHRLWLPQPAEHPPRYTQAIASPPGPLKPCNINGLKGKSAP
jgi:hypothetical protein